MNYLAECHMINNKQFGFRKKLLNTMAVINMVEKITKALDEKLSGASEAIRERGGHGERGSASL